MKRIVFMVILVAVAVVFGGPKRFGVISTNNDPEASIQKVAGVYCTRDTAFTADINLVTHYPGLVCYMIECVAGTPGVVLYRSWDVQTGSKIFNFDNNTNSGLQDQITNLIYSGSGTGMTLKLYFWKQS